MVEKRQELGYPSMKNQQHFRIHPMNSPHMHQYITLLFSLLVDFFQNPSRWRGRSRCYTVEPEEMFSRERSRGTGPRATVNGRLCFTVGRGPVPRRASIGTRNGFGWRAVFARVERSRGTGPRATGQG